MIDRRLSDSPIPHTLKRKRGPSLGEVAGDLSSGKPALGQTKDHIEDEIAIESKAEDLGESGDDSDSSGSFHVPNALLYS